MAIPVLLILAVLWAAVLVPPVLRSRSESRRRGTVGDFTSRLGALTRQPSARHSARTRPGRSLHAVPVPGASRPIASGAAAPMSRAQKRRRNVLIITGSAAIATLLVALVLGSPLLWIVQVLTDVMLGAYVVLLIHMKRRGALTSLQRRLDTWQTPPRGTRAVSLTHPPVPPRPELAPLSPDASSLPQSAAR